eukprot:3110361-Amphidinium_carterae.1
MSLPTRTNPSRGHGHTSFGMVTIVLIAWQRSTSGMGHCRVPLPEGPRGRTSGALGRCCAQPSSGSGTTGAARQCRHGARLPRLPRAILGNPLFCTPQGQALAPCVGPVAGFLATGAFIQVHTPGRLALGEGHLLHEVLGEGTFIGVICSRCGGFSTRRWRKLAQPCRPLPGHTPCALTHLRRGYHPDPRHQTTAWQGAPIAPDELPQCCPPGPCCDASPQETSATGRSEGQSTKVREAWQL